MTAYVEILNYLRVDENVSGVVFGNNYWQVPVPYIPSDSLGKLMTWDQAAGYFTKFNIRDVFDKPAFIIWTNQRAIFLSRYDGVFELQSVPLIPQNCKPETFGGG